MSRKTVIVRFEVDGFHKYPGAPAAVDFLSSMHRHSFEIKCGYRVEDTNREKEIFICREQVMQFVAYRYGIPAQFSEMSCEMIAEKILTAFQKQGMWWCEVWEENTGGARVEI